MTDSQASPTTTRNPSAPTRSPPPRRARAPPPTWSLPSWSPSSPGAWSARAGPPTTPRSPARSWPTCPSPRPRTSPRPSRAPARRSAPGPRRRSGSRAAVLLRFHDLVLARQAEVLDLIQLETGKARLHAHEEVQARRRRRPPLRAQGARLPEAQAAHGRRAHPDQGHRTAPAARGRRPDRALELPPGTVRRRRAARVRRGQRRGDEARHRDRADRAVGARPADRGGAARRGLPGRPRRGPGRRPRGRQARRLRLLHRLDPHRPRGRPGAPPPGWSASPSSWAARTRCWSCADADVEKAAAGAVRACFSSAGQLCISIERLYVHESIADAFLERFAARTKAMRLGTLARVRRGHGLARRRAPAGDRHPARRGGRRQGRHGSSRAAPPAPTSARYFYEPTILDGVEAPMAVCTEETFGPVVSVYRFRTRTRSIDRANGTPYGLNSSRLDEGRPPRPRGRGAAAHRHGQHQRGVRAGVRQRAVADGRHEGLRSRPPARLGGHPQVHRGPDRRPAARSCRWPRPSAWTTRSTRRS